jgi:hypothetical protein
MDGARMSNEVKAAAQAEAERTFEAFMQWTKRVVYASIFCLVVIMV